MFEHKILQSYGSNRNASVLRKLYESSSIRLCVIEIILQPYGDQYACKFCSEYILIIMMHTYHLHLNCVLPMFVFSNPPSSEK